MPVRALLLQSSFSIMYFCNSKLNPKPPISNPMVMCAQGAHEKCSGSLIIKKVPCVNGYIADGSALAMLGGPNTTPTIESGESYLKLVTGETFSQKIMGTVDFCCAAVKNSTKSLPFFSNGVAGHANEEKKEYLDESFTDKVSTFDKYLGWCKEWTDQSFRAALISSEPSSACKDIIHCHVLFGAIASSNKPIDISMGHSHKPRALSTLLRKGPNVDTGSSFL